MGGSPQRIMLLVLKEHIKRQKDSNQTAIPLAVITVIDNAK